MVLPQVSRDLFVSRNGVVVGQNVCVLRRYCLFLHSSSWGGSCSFQVASDTSGCYVATAQALCDSSGVQAFLVICPVEGYDFQIISRSFDNKVKNIISNYWRIANSFFRLYNQVSTKTSKPHERRVDDHAFHSART